MRTKSSVEIGPNDAPTTSVIHTLLAGLTADELERLATTVIREHRRRLQKAQELFEEIERLEATDSSCDKLEQLTDDYRIAMLDLHAQHQIVGLVIERLGYVPIVDGQRPALN
jgi:hypothetical protein